jgi:hypothetical protein
MSTDIIVWACKGLGTSEQTSDWSITNLCTLTLLVFEFWAWLLFATACMWGVSLRMLKKKRLFTTLVNFLGNFLTSFIELHTCSSVTRINQCEYSIMHALHNIGTGFVYTAPSPLSTNFNVGFMVKPLVTHTCTHYLWTRVCVWICTGLTRSHGAARVVYMAEAKRWYNFIISYMNIKQYVVLCTSNLCAVWPSLLEVCAELQLTDCECCYVLKVVIAPVVTWCYDATLLLLP